MNIFSKVMTFEKAKKKLAKLAKGDFHAIAYDLHMYTSSPPAAKCSLYISGYSHAIAPTWAEAFDILNGMINPKHVVVNTKEQPL